MTGPALTLIPADKGRTRTKGDRLELLTALIAAPSFDPLLRSDAIQMPPDHPVYGWGCAVAGCRRSRDVCSNYCSGHWRQWLDMRRSGATVVDFLRTAEPLPAPIRGSGQLCLICPHARAVGAQGLCFLHTTNYSSWRRYRRSKNRPDAVELFVAEQHPYPVFGQCRIATCPEEAVEWIGLCFTHFTLYSRSGRPGGAHRVRNWGRRPGDGSSRHVEVAYQDAEVFDQWCAAQHQFGRMDGRLSLLGLHPLARAEIKWGLHQHATKDVEGGRWQLMFVQNLATECREQDAVSLVDLDLQRCKAHTRKIAWGLLDDLRPVYFSRQDTRDAGFIEIGHYGLRFPDTARQFDLTPVTQRWLRDLLWDCLDLRLTTDPPRSAAFMQRVAHGCAELSGFLEGHTPDGGHTPSLLTRNHMVAFIADQRRRAVDGLPALARQGDTRRGPRGPRRVTAGTMAQVFTGARHILRTTLESGACERLGLDRGFIIALPYGRAPKGRRQPYSDAVARALAAEDNLQKLDGMDAEDRGLRDVWEALVVTGRRCGEVLRLRLDCVDRHNGLPMFWHDQTKVGNLDASIRISERLYQRIRRRQEKTLHRFIQTHGRPPTAEERSGLALFTRRSANRSGRNSVSYPWFRSLFSSWVAGLDIPHSVAHQARHTLATNLIKAGANLAHVKRYLGHVSEAMAEHYVHLANTDPRLEQALQAVWVAGPGSSEPGLLLSSGRPMTAEEAAGLAIDLARTSTPADGGFCTFQPVVNGDACPWNLNCHSCDKFVLSGADLLYWHRKREQWHALAERAPDSATADFLHDAFEPTARAIAGLEQALDAVGLLDDALALDLRRPQDYFGRIWTTAFLAQDLSQCETEEEQITP